MKQHRKHYLNKIFDVLFEYYGPQHWWPGDGPEEMIIGAVLTQNTAWSNVEKAIKNLRTHNLLSLKKLSTTSENTLAIIIKPTGYYNIKAKRLISVANFFVSYDNGNFKKIAKTPLLQLREKFLAVYGIGKETADSILLYALSKPIYVIDAYTLRFLKRHQWICPNAKYDDVQELFHRHLSHDAKLFNEYHALIVKLGKEYCRPKAKCDNCPLNKKYLFKKGRQKILQ